MLLLKECFEIDTAATDGFINCMTTDCMTTDTGITLYRPNIPFSMMESSKSTGCKSTGCNVSAKFVLSSSCHSFGAICAPRGPYMAHSVYLHPFLEATGKAIAIRGALEAGAMRPIVQHSSW